jgi:hypothetical protein
MSRSQGTPCSSQLIWAEGRIAELEQQLVECQKFDAWKANPYTKVLEDSLAECQAREKVLRDALALSWSEEYVNGIIARSKARDALTLPFDSTALDAMLKQAKREALLEAADIFEILGGASTSQLRRMAKELE